MYIYVWGYLSEMFLTIEPRDKQNIAQKYLRQTVLVRYYKTLKKA